MNVIRTFLRSVSLVTVMLAILSCTNYYKAKASISSELTLKEYFTNQKKFDGDKVTVPGHLVSQGDVLHLYESADRPLKLNAPRMLILDTTPSRESGFEEIFESHKCTDQYVKITGRLGQIPSPNIFGMTEVYEIRLFEDRTFIGEGEVCYIKN